MRMRQAGRQPLYNHSPAVPDTRRLCMRMRQACLAPAQPVCVLASLGLHGVAACRPLCHGGCGARLQGTVPGEEHRYALDHNCVFDAGRAVPVSGNTAAILSGSWLAKHFRVRRTPVPPCPG
jgi:hypothetical protein